MNRIVATFILAAYFVFTSVSPAAANQSSAQGEGEQCPPVYTVQRGDTLRSIAKRCGLTLARVVQENPDISIPNRIFPGQQIKLPVAPMLSATAQPAGEVQPAAPATSMQATAAVQPAEPPEEQAAGVEEAPVIYHVQRGDSLGKIARAFDMPLNVLLLANPAITNPNRIYVNQAIVLPTPEQLKALMTEQERREAEEQQRIVDTIGLDGERWIDVDLRQQKVRAYEGRELVKTFVVSTGRARTPTVTGQYKIWIKLEFDDMRGPGYYLRDVPYVMYFYKGYGLHGTYWHDNFGTPMSHGCVNLRTEDARWLFEFAKVGTVVNVH